MEKDISVDRVVKELVRKKRALLKTAGVVALISIVLALLMPDEYQSQVVIVPVENSSQELGGTLGNLATIAGVDLGAISGSESLSPMLYPKIISSTPFVSGSLESSVMYQGDEMQLKEYLSDEIRRTPFGFLQDLLYLPAKIRRSLSENPNDNIKFADSSLLAVTYDEMELMEMLRDRVWIESDDESGSVGVYVKMQDPKIAAKVAHLSYQYLTDYLRKHITAKEKRKLEFILSQYEKTKAEYISNQEELADFVYSNRNVQDPRFTIRKAEIESRVTLSGDIFFQLAKELETTRIQLENQTPVFTVLEPAVIPVEKAYPSRTLIVFLSVFSGLLIHSGKIVLTLQKRES